MCWQPCYPPCTNLWHQMLLRIKHNLKGRHQSVDWVSNLAAHSLVSLPASTSVPIHTVTFTTWTTVALWWVPCQFALCLSCAEGVEQIVQIWLINFQLWVNVYLSSNMRLYCKQLEKQASKGDAAYFVSEITGNARWSTVSIEYQ